MLEAPLSACYRAVIDRKLKTVGNRDDCEVYFLHVYKPVFYDVKAQRFRADIIIEFDGGEDRKFQLRAVQVPQFRHPIEIEANKACNSGILRTPLNGQSPSEKQLLFVGVNPALQCLMKLGSDIKVGNVNRAEQILDGIGGKGQNSAVAVSHLMSMFKKGVVCAPPCVAMFAGGCEGEALVDFLQKKGIGVISQPCVAQTRVCYTITGGKMPATELVGTWEGQISNIESNNFLQLLSKFCKNQNNLQGIGIMGSLPPGISEDNFYSGVLNVLVSNLPPHEKPKVLLDSIHGLPNALQVGFVDILKINADELFGPISTSLNLKPPPSKTSGGDELEEVDIMNDIAFLSLTILDLFPSLSWIGVTDGPREAALFGRKQSGVGIDCYTFVLPTDNLNNYEEFLYPTGAGDTCSAVTLSEWVNGRPIHDAFRVGLAAASASCIQPENANFKFDDMCSIYERTIWTKMFFR